MSLSAMPDQMVNESNPIKPLIHKAMLKDVNINLHNPNSKHPVQETASEF
jgi:hypothetical protein